MRTIDFDLHIHCAPYSTCATQTAEQAVLQAKEVGLKTIAVCNHNTVADLPAFRKLCDASGITMINGIELAVSVPGLSPETDDKVFHLLGYGFAWKPESFEAALYEEQRNYEERLLKICEYLRTVGYDIVDCKSTKNLRLQLVQKGYFSTEKEAKSYLGSQAILERFPKRKMQAEKAVDLIHSLGGKVFWAHPNRAEGHKIITPQQIEIIGDRLIGLGLDGLEVFHPDPVFAPGAVEQLLSIAKERDLLVSLGSDTHHYHSRPTYFTQCVELLSYRFDFEALKNQLEEKL